MSFTIDHVEIDVPCPVCDFTNPASIQQIRTRDVLICRGCKTNVQLDDHMNQARVAERKLRKAMDELLNTLGGLGTIRIEL